MGIVSIVVLLEKGRLRGSLFRFAKVAQPYPDQAKPLMLAKGNSFAQTERNVRQFFTRSRRRVWRMAAGEDLELFGFQLKNHRAPNA
jgi:hypothetical protein